MSHVEAQSAGVRESKKKKMDMGLWLTILFGVVLMVGFGLMVIDVLLK
jgi:hypothetical protein